MKKPMIPPTKATAQPKAPPAQQQQVTADQVYLQIVDLAGLLRASVNQRDQINQQQQARIAELESQLPKAPDA